VSVNYNVVAGATQKYDLAIDMDSLIWQLELNCDLGLNFHWLSI
jgi:hypothetical protein